MGRDRIEPRYHGDAQGTAERSGALDGESAGRTARRQLIGEHAAGLRVVAVDGQRSDRHDGAAGVANAGVTDAGVAAGGNDCAIASEQAAADQHLGRNERAARHGERAGGQRRAEHGGEHEARGQDEL